MKTNDAAKKIADAAQRFVNGLVAEITERVATQLAVNNANRGLAILEARARSAMPAVKKKVERVVLLADHKRKIAAQQKGWRRCFFGAQKKGAKKTDSHEKRQVSHLWNVETAPRGTALAKPHGRVKHERCQYHGGTGQAD